MPRGKGHKGETCAEATRSAIKPGEVLAFKELSGRIRKMGSWKDDAIWQHLMGLVVNLPPARHHWPNTKPFLFLRPDGRYELYNSKVHPKVLEE